MNRTLILLAIITATSSGYASADTDTRKSPYFIDGIHCEGLQGLLDESAIKRSYPSEEVAIVGVKTVQQSRCEAIFYEFGVEKFQWVTPEDLEKLSFTLKRSNKFRTVDIHIEKSELQNHVHLIGRFALFAAQNHYALNLYNAFENGKGDTGSRTTSKADGTINFGQRGPNNPAPYILGFQYFNWGAAHPLSADQLRSGGQDVTMTPNEQAAWARYNGSYNNINFRINFPYSSAYRGIQPFLTTSMNSTHMTGDKNSTSNYSEEVGVEFQNDPLMRTITRLSLLYATYSATGYQIYDSSIAKSSNDKALLFAGITQDWDSQIVSGRARLYRSLTSELHYFADFDMTFHLGEYAGLAHGIGFSEALVRGGVLPEQRFGLPDSTNFQVYYCTDHSFVAMGADNKVMLKLGAAEYQANNNLTNPYATNQLFGELSLKRQTPDFDLGLAIMYANQRLY